jgi:hypothetical protein
MLLKDLKIMVLEKKWIFRVGSETGSGTFLKVGSGSLTLRKVGSGSGTKSFGSTTLVTVFPVPHLIQEKCVFA